jgi:cyanophycinase
MESRGLKHPRGPACWAHIPLIKGEGALLIIGGGGTPPMIHDLFFHLAGDEQARLLHMPSATRLFEEIPNKEEYYSEFFGRAKASFQFLHTYDRAEAERKEFAAPIDSTTGVWIGGGTQGRLSDLFLGTEVLAAINRLLDRGGVVAGTSSGATIMSDAMILFGYEEVELGQGFALWPRATIDTHYTIREREKRIARAVLQRPDHVGIGLDEKTTMVVQGRLLGVLGAGDGSAWFQFADGRGGVLRYRLRMGETTTLPVPARGIEPRVLQQHLERLGPPHVITAEDLVVVPEPEPEPEPAGG